MGFLPAPPPHWREENEERNHILNRGMWIEVVAGFIIAIAFGAVLFRSLCF